MAPTSKKEARAPTATCRASRSKANSLACGFTLVEMLVVVVVLALLAATATVKWSGVHHNAVAAAAVDRLEFLDQQLRSYARSRGTTCALALDRQQHRVRKTGFGEQEGSWEPLGSGVRLADVRLPETKSTRQRIEVPYDAQGCSSTYGVHLAGPGKHETWLLIAGVSGQLTQFDSETKWHAALQRLSTRL